MDLYSPVQAVRAVFGRRNCAGLNENGRFLMGAPVNDIRSVGARLARDGNAKVFLIHRVASIAGKPCFDRWVGYWRISISTLLKRRLASKASRPKSLPMPERL